MYKNEHLLNKTVEITIAKLSSSEFNATKDTGKATADFMQEVYDKLVELNAKEVD